MVDFKSLSFGVELECTNQTREIVAQAIQSVVGGTVEHVGSPSSLDPWHVTDKCGRIWKVVADSSLSDAPPNLRAEVVTKGSSKALIDTGFLVSSITQKRSRRGRFCIQLWRNIVTK